MNLDEETIRNLEDEKYKYEVKLIGRKLDKEEKLSSYCNI
jgi:hypothetical protein